MRRISLFMILGLFAVTSSAMAAQAKPMTTPAKATASSTKAAAAPVKPREAWAAGQLERIDATSVVVKQGTHEMTFSLGSSAQIVEGTKTVQASDMSQAIGHQVKVRYVMNGSSRVADRIEVAASMPHAPASATKKP